MKALVVSLLLVIGLCSYSRAEDPHDINVPKIVSMHEVQLKNLTTEEQYDEDRGSYTVIYLGGTGGVGDYTTRKLYGYWLSWEHGWMIFAWSM